MQLELSYGGRVKSHGWAGWTHQRQGPWTSPGERQKPGFWLISNPLQTWICRHKLSFQREDGAAVLSHVPSRRAGGLRRGLDLPARPSAAAVQLHSNQRMEKGVLNPLMPPAAVWDPRVLQAGETGADDNRDSRTETGQVCPWHSRKNLHDTLQRHWGCFGAVAMRDSTMCMQRYPGPTATW